MESSISSLPGQLGIQLFTVNDALQADYKGTLSALSQMGYKSVELFGVTSNHFFGDPLGGLDIKEVKALLDSLTLSTKVAHYSPMDDLDNVLHNAAILDTKLLVLPFTPHFIRMDENGPGIRYDLKESDYREVLNFINHNAQRVTDAGFSFAYHNHDVEFLNSITGKTGFDFIVDNTDPDKVSFELDLGWTARAGLDPVEALNRYGQRLVALHLKDFDANIHQPENAMPVFSDLGQGKINWSEVIKAVRSSRVENCFIEVDFSEDGMAAAEKAANFAHSEFYQE